MKKILYLILIMPMCLVGMQQPESKNASLRLCRLIAKDADNTPAIKRLLRAGAAVDALDAHEKTSIIYAIEGSYTATLRLLLTYPRRIDALKTLSMIHSLRPDSMLAHIPTDVFKNCLMPYIIQAYVDWQLEQIAASLVKRHCYTFKFRTTRSSKYYWSRVSRVKTPYGIACIEPANLRLASLLNPLKVEQHRLAITKQINTLLNTNY